MKVLKIRRMWTRSPITKVKPSGKIYQRKHMGQKELQEIISDTKNKMCMFCRFWGSNWCDLYKKFIEPFGSCEDYEDVDEDD